MKMAYSNYRSGWGRDRDERGRSPRDWDDDDSRRARESMERDYHGSEMSGGRGGYGGWRGEHEDPAPRYNRGYGQGDYDQEYGRRESAEGQSGRYSESGYGRGREYLGGGGRHHGNESGGWPGREEEQWRNRDVHGRYDREANYGGFSSSGTGNYRGYGGSGGSYRGGQGRWAEAGTQYGQGGGSQGDYNYRGYERERYGQQRLGQGYGDERRFGGGYGQSGYGQSRGLGSTERPSGGRAYGDYSGTPSGYFGDEYGSLGQGIDQWGTQQDYGAHRGRGPRGYKRSDDRIREEVCDCLTDDDRLDATNIDVAVKDGEVTLSGTTTSREDKRWAESLAERISGVKEVQNSLRVQDQRSQPGPGQIASATSTTGTGRAADKGKDSNIQH
jgi:hypothetical protein